MLDTQGGPLRNDAAWTVSDSISSEVPILEELGRRHPATSAQGDSATAVEAFNKDTTSCDEAAEHVDSLQRLLAKQFSHMQRVLTESYDSARSVASRHAEALRRVENEVNELAGENEKFRARLAAAGLTANGSETAGTGESTWGSMNKAAQRGLNAAGSAVRDRASKVRGYFSAQEPPLPPPTDTEVLEPTSRAPGMNVPGAAWTCDIHEPPDKPPTESRGQSTTFKDPVMEKVNSLSISRDTLSRRCSKTLRLREDHHLGPHSMRNSASLRISGNSVHSAHHLAVVPMQAPRNTRRSENHGRQSMMHEEDGHHDEHHWNDALHEGLELLHLAPGGNKAVFADAAAMKEKVRQAIGKEEYNVCNMYHDKGFFATIARNQLFDTLTLSVIALNALWIAIDTDYNKKDFLLDYEPIFQVAENFFCIYFSCEWVIRFMSFKRKRDGLKDGWFVFDSILVFMMVIETWVMTGIVVLTGGGQGGGLKNASILRLLRLLRLTRMARMARLLRAMPELMIMVKGIAVAARSVFFTLVLLVLIMYVFAICFTQITVDNQCRDAYFQSVPDAMMTLLLYGTLLEDVPDVVLSVGKDSYLFGALFLLFILLASLTVMNMLVGVLVEVVSVVSAVEKETLVVNFVRSQLQQMLTMSGIDANNDQMISKEEFESLLENPKAANALQEVGVDVVGLVDFTDFIFKDGVELSFPDFMETVLQLRGSNTATVKDVVDLRKFIMSGLEEIEEAILTGRTNKENEQQKANTVILSNQTRAFASTVVKTSMSMTPRMHTLNSMKKQSGIC